MTNGLATWMAPIARPALSMVRRWTGRPRRSLIMLFALGFAFTPQIRRTEFAHHKPNAPRKYSTGGASGRGRHDRVRQRAAAVGGLSGRSLRQVRATGTRRARRR